LIESFINNIQNLCAPDKVHICDGSEEEFNALALLLEKQGTWISLKKREGSFYARSDPNDVARVESRTFICSENKDDAGPTNNWKDPKEMRSILGDLFKGCMKGRTMYVIPYAMGPKNSPYTKFGIEITDFPYVVCSMKIMSRIIKIDEGKDFVLGVHTVGKPLHEGEKDDPWPCNKEKYIAHFPEAKEIWSYGSGYGGNALLGKKCFALRIGSKIAKEEGWLAEHMLIMGLTNPEGKKKYIAAAFPSACGKTNLAMLTPSLKGWKVECVGDDIAWMHFRDDGRLYAVNPENGFFGVAPGTSEKSNPIAMKMIEKKTIFTNVALTKEGDVWWEGMTDEAPEELIDWKGNYWKKGSKEKSAHPNSRFTVSKHSCPIYDILGDDPQGVPIDAIIFGGRRSTLLPLVLEAYSWPEGVLMGASLSSEMTAAAEGELGALRHDPFAMLPFCGYHMGDYFQHWLDLEKPHRKMPQIFSVNWFRKNEKGEYIWPGFGENARVLKWIFNRIELEDEGRKTALGFVPNQLDLKGLNQNPKEIEKLFEVDPVATNKEIDLLRDYFQITFGDRFPIKLLDVLVSWKNRL
jgi:phosphoenolpyruvate carboxykinase (GTP)